MLKSEKINKTVLAYAMLIFVIFLWGASPLINAVLNDKCSVGLRSVLISGISVITLLIICGKRLKNLNKEYLKWALPTGACVAIASITQKIGLYYTTPTKYAFLENLSCVVVPIILFFAIKKRPSALTIISSVLCLIGAFVLGGMNFSAENISFGIGEVLCSLAGVLYGVNIAYTGDKIKKFDALLFLFVQQCASALISTVALFIFASVKINGAPIEVVYFTFDVTNILLILAIALVSNVLCWFLRIYALKFVNPTAVAVMMPFSAVVTGVMSLVVGMDTLSTEFVVGALISLVAVILSSIADIKYEHKA